MLVGLSCFVHSEILLDHGCCKDWAFWSFEHSGWNLHKLSNLILVVDTVEHFFFGRLVQVFSGQLNKLPTIHISQLDIMIGEGPAARSIKLDLPPFTLVGATTRAGLLTSPLRDRFGIVQRLEFYSSGDLSRIVTRSADILNVELDASGAEEIACRSRGTPRIANRLLRRVRDYAEVKGDGRIDQATAASALDMLDVDAAGFDMMDRKLLLAVLQKFDGGPVGIDNLAAAIGEERGTIEDVLEPYLIQQGFLMRTPRGRLATRSAWHHFGLQAPQPAAPVPDLFSDQADNDG